MELTSSVFKNDQNIPIRYSGEGENVSPPLEWSNAPAGCNSFVLICEDPDAPKREGKEYPFVHWLIYDISGSIDLLPERLPKDQKLHLPLLAIQGRNSFGKIGYDGPMPPAGSGAHHYIFTLYALKSELGIEPGATKAEVEEAMRDKILGEARIIGQYERVETQRPRPPDTTEARPGS
jgi:Raf kinase inhibitor-like YbhB/YbcL family protein